MIPFFLLTDVNGKRHCYCYKNVKEMIVSPLIRESRWLYLPVWAVSFFLTLCLCLALPDAKVNNQSQTTKCAMESGDGNTGE